MARIRSNFVRGVLNVGLSDIDTTLSSAGLAQLPAIVAPDYAIITIDPASLFGAPEIVKITAHTSSATTATIVRGQEGTVARAHLVANNILWEHGPTSADWGGDVDYPGAKTFSGATTDIVKARFKSGPWFDVTHPGYGAVGDGSNDDTAAIQAAIDAASAVNGTVYLPPGTFRVTLQNASNALCLHMKSNVCLTGPGILKLGNWASGNISGTRIIGTIASSGYSNVQIIGVTIDGNTGNNVTNTARDTVQAGSTVIGSTVGTSLIVSNGTNFHTNQAIIISTEHMNITAITGNVLTVTRGAEHTVVISTISASNNILFEAQPDGDQGINLSGVANVVIERCEIKNCGSDGIYLHGGITSGGSTSGYCEGARVAFNRIHDNVRVGINAHGSINSVYEGNIIYGTGANWAIKMEFDANNKSRFGNRFINNIAWSVGGGISISGTTTDGSSTTLSGTVLAGATSIILPVDPGSGNLWIDVDGAVETRAIGTVTGTGPYTIQVAALSSGHTSGVTVYYGMMLTANTSVGDTSLVSLTDPGSVGGSILIDPTGTREWTVIDSVSGTGPYTVGLKSPLILAHSQGTALSTGRASDMLIEGNRFNCSATGPVINISSCDDTTISHNTCVGGKSQVIYVQRDCVRLLIEGNDIRGSIKPNSGTSGVITIGGGNSGANNTQMKDIVVRNNTIYAAPQHAIYFVKTTGTTAANIDRSSIEQNHCISCGFEGIALSSTDDISITNNMISDCGTSQGNAAIRFYGPANANNRIDISHNYFLGSSNQTTGLKVAVSGAGFDTKFVDNTFSAITTPISSPNFLTGSPECRGNLLLNGSGTIATLGTTPIQGDEVFVDSADLAFGTSTGTKIGTGTGQKIGFWNATPIIQPTTGVASSTFAANSSGISNNTATWDGYTIGQIVKALRNAGFLA